MGFSIGSYEIRFSFGKKVLLIISAFALLAAVATVYLYYHSPFEGNVFPPCIFRTYLHLYCPGCGATRATYELLHGNLRAAFRYNPLYIIGIPFMMYLGIVLAGIKVNGNALLPEFNFNLRGAIILIGIILAYWILRNVPIFPFTLLRP
ncbi:MAG: DUF2752 domain-containing protein [Bacillota bacterium]|nr:DUF2752 domain-containing protein [Bacillota bacterium]